MSIAVSGPSSVPTTALPPWALPSSAPGTGTQRRELSGGLRCALPEPGPALDRIVLACWLAVLARCVGETDVTTACAGPDGVLAAVTARVADVSWAELADRAVRAPLAGRPHSVLDLGADVAPDTAALVLRLDRAELRIDHDLTRVSADAANRVLGYVVHALSAAAADPDAAVDLAGMLGAAERRRQLSDLCGPRVNNGPDGFVRAFRARAAAQPDRPAAHHRERCLTYAELDAASDRVAARLAGHGVTGGDCVAVVGDRHLDWVVALLGVLKAGAVYLPVRPDFPPSRVSDQLARARCRFAVVDPAGAQLIAAVSADGAWNGSMFDIGALADGSDATDLLPPEPELGQPAYVYFTSGSTGRPKGAVCAHDGMVNHLWAKVDDHDLGPGSVVAQTASQCFDISLWQVCAPLLVGGATVVVDTDQQLDVRGFAELLARKRVTTVQIVPSYLEILLAHLEAGELRLPPLSSISVTGEALKTELVRRWFAAVPDVRLVNAYGATEVSDDTMHAVLDEPPLRCLPVVDVGRPLRNMRVYIVDDRQRLMPEGARGEIVFAGVCVGSGYLNDPDRTAEAFGHDPYVRGERLYRSGDLGRWLPEGRIEFLGRRDEQVKIRGLRVETGEVQAALLRVPDITAAAVIPIGEGNAARLVGFYVSEYELASIDLHDLLSEWLPEYMVPAHYVRLPDLPLNENGKTDKVLLAQSAAQLAAGAAAFEPPATAAEQELGTLWAEVLGLPAGRASRHDSFFDLGGTSLSAVHLLMRLQHRLSLTDLMSCPVLKDQAALLDTSTDAAPRALLHRIDGTAESGRPVLVCVPDAGGNAINFRRLADALGPLAHVLAVELPGHDVARPDEELAPLPAVVRRLVAELRDVPEPYLCGQGAGAAAAIALAGALEAAGRTVGGVIVGPTEDVDPTAVQALSDDAVADRLGRRRAYVEVAGDAPERLRVVARAYRHDWAQALDVFAEAGAPRMRSPVTDLPIDAPVPTIVKHVRAALDRSSARLAAAG